MARRYRRPPLYHAAAPTADRDEALCRTMREALNSYNGLVRDIARGKDYEEFDTFVDVDNYTWYCVAEVNTQYGRNEHHLPDDFEGLAVCYCYVAVAEVPTIDAGAEFISLTTGRLITLVPEPDDGGERWWMPHPIDGDGPIAPPVEPPVRRSERY